MIRNLPSEIHQHIRSFGSNPLIEDKDLFQMITDWNPDYSLTTMYAEVKRWTEGFNELISNDPEAYQIYSLYFKPGGRYILYQKVTMYYEREISYYIIDTMKHLPNILHENLNRVLHNSYVTRDQFLKRIYRFVRLMLGNPISPAIVTTNAANTELCYFHNNSSIVDINNAWVRSLYPSIESYYLQNELGVAEMSHSWDSALYSYLYAQGYNLQREYEKAISLKEYRSRLQLNIKVIEAIINEIESVVYNRQNSEIRINLSKAITYDLPLGYDYFFDEDMDDETGYHMESVLTIKNVPEEQYLALIAYLWKGNLPYLKESENIKYPIPFANHP